VRALSGDSAIASGALENMPASSNETGVSFEWLAGDELADDEPLDTAPIALILAGALA